MKLSCGVTIIEQFFVLANSSNSSLTLPLLVIIHKAAPLFIILPKISGEASQITISPFSIESASISEEAKSIFP